MMSSVLYKSTDAVYIIPFVGALATRVQHHGLQMNIQYHWWTYVLIFIFQDFFFGCFMWWRTNAFCVGVAQNSPQLESF